MWRRNHTNLCDDDDDDDENSSSNLSPRSSLQSELNHVLNDDSTCSAVVHYVRSMAVDSHRHTDIIDDIGSSFVDVVRDVLLRLVTYDVVESKRMLYLDVIDNLFCRWSPFRRVMLPQLPNVLDLCFSKSKSSAERHRAAQLLAKWEARFSSSSDFIKMALHHARHVLNVDIPTSPEIRKIYDLRRQLCEIKNNFTQRQCEFHQILRRIEICFERVLPSTVFEPAFRLSSVPTSINDLEEISSSSEDWCSSNEDDLASRNISQHSSHTALSEETNVEPDDNGTTDDIRDLGLASRSYKICIKFSTDLSDLKSDENTSIFETLHNQASVLHEVAYPLLNQWVASIRSANRMSKLCKAYKIKLGILSEELPRTIVRLNDDVCRALKRCQAFGIHFKISEPSTDTVHTPMLPTISSSQTVRTTTDAPHRRIDRAQNPSRTTPSAHVFERGKTGKNVASTSSSRSRIEKRLSHKRTRKYGTIKPSLKKGGR